MKKLRLPRTHLVLAGLAFALASGVGLDSAHAQMVTGTYTGDGLAGRTIVGLGFRPDIVLLKVDSVTSR